MTVSVYARHIPAPQATIRQRKRHTKARSGCLTCKRRHVKCDEKKPSCLQCKRAGQKCEGYEVNPWTFVKTSASPQEIRATQFYHERVIPLISSVFDGIFWRDLVSVAAASEPAIRHALVALSSTFEAINSRDSLATQRIAWEQCNKSIQVIRARTNPTKSVLLIAALLFMFNEVLQGRLAGGIRHMLSVLKLSSADQMGKLDPRLINYFENILYDYLLICGPHIDLTPQSPWLRFVGVADDTDVPIRLDNPRHVKQALFPIIARRQICASLEQLAAMASAERHATRQWRKRIDMSRMSVESQIATMTIQAISLVSLPVYHGYSAQKECMFDSYEPDIAEALVFCERVHQHQLNEGKHAHWSKYRPVHHVLMAIALICRDPKLRRQAIALLRGIYRPTDCGSVEILSTADKCQLIMEVEERGAKRPVLSSADLPEHLRVRLCSKSTVGPNGGSIVRWVRYPYKDDGPYEEAFIPATTTVADDSDSSSSSSISPSWERPSIANLSQFYVALFMGLWKSAFRDPNKGTHELIISAADLGVGHLEGYMGEASAPTP